MFLFFLEIKRIPVVSFWSNSVYSDRLDSGAMKTWKHDRTEVTVGDEPS